RRNCSLDKLLDLKFNVLSCNPKQGLHFFQPTSKSDWTVLIEFRKFNYRFSFFLAVKVIQPNNLSFFDPLSHDPLYGGYNRGDLLLSLIHHNLLISGNASGLNIPASLALASALCSSVP